MGKKRSKKAIPKKGDPDYLTPTQLRNRRKRRAKQQKAQQKEQEGTGTSPNDLAAADAKSKNNAKPTSSTKHGQASSKKDPSMKYISNPMKAPIVQAAKQYFQPILKNCDTSEFHVHIGPLSEWRTVSKLAVRPADNCKSADAKPEVAIGLFLPQTHTLLPVPNCRAHHPSINKAVECITKACHEVGVEPYQENGKGDTVGGDGTDGVTENNSISNSKDMIERGNGQLRYVAINVARETGAVQITLVWNTPPPNDEDGSGSKRKFSGVLDDTVLEKLVTKIISMSNDSSSNNLASETKDLKNESSSSMSNTANEPRSEEPAKKRRRRGRREGKTNADIKKDSSDGNNSSEKTARDVSNDVTKSTKRKKFKLNLHSLWINYNPSWKHSNAIFSFDSFCWKHVHGPLAIVEHLTLDKTKMKTDNKGGQQLLATPTPPHFSIPLNFPPNVFRQANLDSFTNIVGRIRERIKKLAASANGADNHAIELYGGVGTIGLHISDIVSSLVSSDENPNNAKCFFDSVRTLPATIQSRLEYKQKNAADMVLSESALFQKSNLLIVDPPRKGLDDEVVDYLCGDKKKTKNLELIVYVSCGFQAFQRDCDALVQSGRWRVEFAEGYLLFPGADAIETLAFFVPV